MRTRAKLALGAGLLAATVVLALVLLPFLFRDRIASRLKAEIASSVNARVDWRSASVGLLRDFPNASLSLNDLSVVGVQPFAGDTLAAVTDARLVLELGSVVGFLRHGDPIVVREVVLERPRVGLRVLADGRANWDIARPSTATTKSGRTVGVTLRNLQLSDGTVTLDDRHANLVLALHGLDETLSGDFASEKFLLSTRTRVDSAFLRFAGIPWLSRAAIRLDADVDADLRNNRFTFRRDTLKLNELLLAFEGSATLGKPDMTLDLAFAAPGNAFRDILSLVPAVYATDFAKLRTAGRMSVSGRVRGSYGPHAFPSFAIRARVDSGAFKDPSLPLPARGIFMDLAMDNPGGHMDSTVVSLKRFHAELGGRPVDARLVVRTPMTDPDVDLRLRGALDLADLARTVKLPDVQSLAGLVSADVAMRARLSDVNASRYDRVTASGSAYLSRLSLRSANLPHAVAVDTAALRFTPRAAQLSTLAARVGNSDLRATGSLDNLLGFLMHDEELRGAGSVASSRFDLSEWVSKDKSTEVIPVPPRVDFSLDASASHVTYGALALDDVRGRLRVKDQRVTLDSLRMNTLRGSVVANGAYDTRDLARPAFDLSLQLDSVDIPASVAALATVQKLAPVARWTRGNVTGTMAMKGLLAKDMSPVLAALSGRGDLKTSGLVVQNSSALQKISSALASGPLHSPALGAVRLAFDVADGRVNVKPFDLTAGGLKVPLGGANGIGRVAEVKQQADSAATNARRRASEEAARIVAEADSQAAGIRAQARALADSTRSLAKVRADSVVARATNPMARVAAQAAADRLRRETDQQADRMVREADARADKVVAQARQRAGTLAPVPSRKEGQ
ncbi:MAG TPA: AsmA-like C-terminal region-containing protein [Gemmatimonadaceae bacterium]|nr:AsmA-like C-terminal region-containing protein [Gemmatimonadaceae bacterium]